MNAASGISRRPGLLVETSALVAIILEESDWQSLTQTILASNCQTASTNILEAVLAVARQSAATPTEAHETVLEFTAKLSIQIVPYAPEMVAHAVSARERYGRSRNALNMGDCLSYGAAKQIGLTLLYKGSDFAATDVNE